jgi:hypothetical protein
MVHPPLESSGIGQQRRLVRAFDRVRDPRDWKGPIQAVIPSKERRVVQRAVIIFTESWPIFHPIPGHKDQLVVTAPGYRLGPAGSRAIEQPPSST